MERAGCFPGAERYRVLREPGHSLLREASEARAAFPYSERHLQCVWFDAAYRPARLRTAAGEEVAVEDPGRWNLEAGPDFVDAVLRVGAERRRVQGDVEVHVHPRDWEAHRHFADARYRRVVAHVCYFPGRVAPGRLPAGAVELALRPALQSDPGFAFEDIDVTAYPYAARTTRPTPCAVALKGWGWPERAALLRAAGAERLRLKAERLQAAIAERGAEQALYEELMAGLGYQHNRAACRRLARRLPAEALRREAGGDAQVAYALLLGVAGLLPARLSAAWDEATRVFVREVWDAWWKRQSAWESAALSPGEWRCDGLRPQNHPARRLAAAAGLFAGAAPLAEVLLALDTERPREWLAAARRLLRAEGAVPYWKRRLGWGCPERRADVALLGQTRLAALLSNVVVPFLAASGRSVAPLLEALPPEQDNALIRQTAHNLFGRDHNPARHQGALLQQGLLQIFHDFCLTRRGGCAGCRLAPALAAAGGATALAAGGRGGG